MTERLGPKDAKVLVLGLDGATFDLIRPWAEGGLLPTFRRLMKEGCWGELTSTVPPFTAPAWSSFSTGTNPGKHGLYDFSARRPGTYEMIPLNASALRTTPLWQLLGKDGRRVVVLNVPVTYPPRPVNGLMVTGMLTPANTRCFTHPPELGAELIRAVPGYTIWPEGVFHPLGREFELVEVVRKLTDMRFEAMRYLMGRIEWDFFMAVFRGPDLLQHWLWRFMEGQDGPGGLKEGILDIYRQLDGILASLLELLPKGTTLILMSDHGAGPLDSYIHVNTWLLEEGYLRIKKGLSSTLKHGLFRWGLTPRAVYRVLMRGGLGKGVGKTIRHRKTNVRDLMGRVFLSFKDVDWPRTLAYSYGNVGPIYINLKGREPQGSVDPGMPYERLRGEIAQKLRELREPSSGLPLVETVYRKEDLYQGDALDEAPDLFFMPRDLRYQGFGLLQFTSNRWLERSFDRSGGHRMNGLLLLWGAGVKRGVIQGANMTDLAPTILALLGSPIPTVMDGSVLRDAFHEALWGEREIRFIREEASQRDVDHQGLSEEELEEIQKRLKGLGYV